ncbi:1713_t:CDS:2 [Acaulospora morrowiae]|uniref:1713_t:CDS:1 n=1 Tax=Acaulospora morrowiae TaxID=94023 RepID=A0A9N8YP84_9GLOM|nr:1713_t:CDS:2 [Acaulospora morrowiae]
MLLRRIQSISSSVAVATSTPLTDDPYITSGGLAYGILCTVSLFLMIILAIIYGRLAYNRVFVYFCLSMITLYVPHILGAWIYGANLRRAPTAICWIQALWINASGISAGITALIYSFEIYRNIVKQRVTDGEWKRRKYYMTISIVFPLFVGIVPPFLIADKSDGIAPGPFFCVLNKPSIPLVFVSVSGWNTLSSLLGIYFLLSTCVAVINLFRNRKGFNPGKSTAPQTTTQGYDLGASTPQSNGSSVTMSRENSIIYEDLSEDSFSGRTFGRIPIYVCFRLALFLIMYCAMFVLIYGRSLVVNLKQDDLSVKEPKYVEYIVASLGIVIFLIFGTSLEACTAYWRFLKAVFNFKWLNKCIGREESFGDWETSQRKRTGERGVTTFMTSREVTAEEGDTSKKPSQDDDYLTIIRRIPPILRNNK